MVAMRQRSRNSHLLDYLQVNDEIDLWHPQLAIYTYCRITHVLPGDFHRLEFPNGVINDVNLRLEQWRFTGQSAHRVWACLQNRTTTTN